MFSERIRTSRNRAEVLNGKRDWFRIEAKSAGETDVSIYDEIGFFGVTASQFTRELALISTPTINLHLNSPGGDVFDGIAIYNALKAHKATVNVVVDSIAASIASVIAMAGDTVTMSRGSMMMIHEPFALVIGDSREMRKAAESLDLMGDSIAEIYSARAGKTREDWRDAMAEETWYSADDAVKAGLADSVGEQAAAKNTFDLSIFRNGPKPVPSTPEPEKAEDREPIDIGVVARRRIAAAQLEVVRAHAH